MEFGLRRGRDDGSLNAFGAILGRPNYRHGSRLVGQLPCIADRAFGCPSTDARDRRADLRYRTIELENGKGDMSTGKFLVCLFQGGDESLPARLVAVDAGHPPVTRRQS